MSSPQPAKSVAEISVTPVNKKIQALKSEYRNVKHPSETKLLSPEDKLARLEAGRDTDLGLTKAELLECANEPFWVNLRRILLWGTVLSFVVFFVSAIVILYMHSDCIRSRSGRLDPVLIGNGTASN